MKQYEKILKAFANKRRLEIIKYLKTNKKATVGDLATHLKLSFKSTSKHLAVLSGVDIVDKEQLSLFVLYSLSPKQDPISKSIISIV